ncbi:MAG: DUF1294 domain-containing protein [Clostridiales bacterium]|nr:DUF1294 domain-containing protein [Clostridiales bacterium]
MEKTRIILLVYLGALSIYAITISIYDKIAAKKYPRRRIRERTLLLTAIVGGAPAMFIILQFIRHKTKHLKIIATVAALGVLWAGIYLYIIFRFELVWNAVINLF